MYEYITQLGLCCSSKPDQEMQKLTRCICRSVLHRGHIAQARLSPAVLKPCGSVSTPTLLCRDQPSLAYRTLFTAFGTRTVLNSFRGFSGRSVAVSDPRSRRPTAVAARSSRAAEFKPGMSGTRPLTFSSHPTRYKDRLLVNLQTADSKTGGVL